MIFFGVAYSGYLFIAWIHRYYDIFNNIYDMTRCTEYAILLVNQSASNFLLYLGITGVRCTDKPK